MMRTTLFAAPFIAALALTPAAMAQQEGLVNVNISNVKADIAKDLNVDVSALNKDVIQVPVGVAANVCGVDANVLAEQKKAGDASCDATSSSKALSQIVKKDMGG